MHVSMDNGHHRPQLQMLSDNIKKPPYPGQTWNLHVILSRSLSQEFKEVCKNLNKEQIEATFKKFDQTGNDKLSFREFRDMMGKRSESKGKLVKQSGNNGKQSGNNVKQSGNNGKQPGNTGEQSGNDVKQSGNNGKLEATSSGDKQATSSKQICHQAKTGKEGDQANPWVEPKMQCKICLKIISFNIIFLWLLL